MEMNPPPNSSSYTTSTSEQERTSSSDGQNYNNGKYSQQQQVQVQVGQNNVQFMNGGGRGDGGGCTHCYNNSSGSHSQGCPLSRGGNNKGQLGEGGEGGLRAIKVVESSATTVRIPPGTVSSPTSANNVSSTTATGLSSSEGEQQEQQKESSLPRKWKYFPGKNKFYCNGRLMTAPTIRFCVMCFALIVVTFSLFIIFDGPFLGERLSIWIPIVGFVLFISVIVNMIKTSFSDPGILPRASQQESEYMEKLYATNNQSRPPPRTKDIVVNGQTMKSKYCFTCKMFRPPRASHCGVCDNCVDRFDHHCPFLGNCIGKRNYRSFYAFIISLSFLSVFVLSCSIAHLVLISKEKGNFLEALKETPTSAVVVVISFFGMWTVLGLAGFHTYLIAVEQTTNEDIKGLFGRSAVKNPFSKGNFCQNCCFVLCGPLQPSLVDPRGLATEDFIFSLPKKPESNGGASTNKCTGIQNSIKTGPHCVEGPVGTPGGVNKVYQQQPLMQHQSHVHNGYQEQSESQSQPYSSDPDDGGGPTQVLSIRMDEEMGGNHHQHHHHHYHQDNNMGKVMMMPHPQQQQQQHTPPTSNRSLGEITSESLKNLYYSSIEEVPGEDDDEEMDERNTSTTITITPEPIPLSRIRRQGLAVPNGGSSSSSQQLSKMIETYGRMMSDDENDDFDDPVPSAKIRTVSGSLDRMYFDDVEDLNDPMTTMASSSVSNHRGMRNNNKSSTGRTTTTNNKKKKAPSVGSLGLGLGLPNNNNSASSLVSSDRSSVKMRGGTSNLKKSVGNNNNSSSSSLRQKGGGGGVGGGGGSSSSRKMSDSTMIDSPLHLDPVT